MKRNWDRPPGKKPDEPWTAPSKEERIAQKKEGQTRQQESRPATDDEKLFAASRDRFLTSLDFHGKTREDVDFELEQFLRDNPDSSLRIAVGHSRGVVAAHVNQTLRRLKGGKQSIVQAYRDEPGGVSFVVITK